MSCNWWEKKGQWFGSENSVHYTPADEWRPRIGNHSFQSDEGFVLSLVPKLNADVWSRVVRRRLIDAVADAWKHRKDVNDIYSSILSASAREFPRVLMTQHAAMQRAASPILIASWGASITSSSCHLWLLGAFNGWKDDSLFIFLLSPLSFHRLMPISMLSFSDGLEILAFGSSSAR